MIWSIRLVLLSSVVFSTQIIFGAGQASIPWESTQSAENFIASFQRAIARSSAFSSTQQNDMSTIRKTLAAAIEKFNISNTTAKTKFQALNMVFASAVAEITATKGDVNIELKTNAIENALNSAFLETFGIINSQFVSDIKNLIYILAHTTANGVSTASEIKVGGYKQRSLKQQEPSSSAEIMRLNGSVPQQGPGTEQQQPPSLTSSMALNATGGTQGSSLQSIFQKQDRRLPVANSQGPLGSESWGSSPQVPSAQDELGPGDYKTGIATAAETEGGLGPAGQSSSTSGVNRLPQQDPGDNKQIGQESARQGKYRASSQRPVADGSTASPTAAASGSYGVGSVTLGLPGLSGIGGSRSSIQETAGNQRPSGYGTRAAASAVVGENESVSNTKVPLGQISSGSKEQEKSTRVSDVAENQNQRPEASKLGSNGWSAAASVSGAVAGFKPFIGTGESQESKGPTGKDAKVKDTNDSRSSTAVITGSFVNGIGAERYRQEGKDVQIPSRTRSQNERESQAHVLSRQIPFNQAQYGTVYQKAMRFGVQAPDVYPPRAVASASAGEYGPGSSARVSGEQRSTDVRGQRIDIRKPSKAEIQSINSKDYGNGVAFAIAAAESGNESSSGEQRLQETGGKVLSNSSAVDKLNNYASGKATAIAAAGSTTLSSISTSNSSSEIPSVVSSLVSGSSAKPFALSNTVSSIVSQVSAANPDLSHCNVLIQTLLEIISTLVHLLGSCNIGQFNFGTSNQSALMTRQSATKDNS